MEKSAVNRQSLYDIDSCYNIICLDDEDIPVTVSPARENGSCKKKIENGQF